jgi:hypothetical protein
MSKSIVCREGGDVSPGGEEGNVDEKRTNEDVAPPSVLSEVRDDALDVLGREGTLDAVEEGLSGFGGRGRRGGRDLKRCGEDVLEVLNYRLDAVEDGRG